MMPRAAHEPPPDARAAAGWGTLTPATSWGGDDAARPGEPVEGARDAVEAGRPDALADYQPPFEVTADLLVVPALCPTAPLRRAFPSVPFLSLLGRTPRPRPTPPAPARCASPGTTTACPRIRR
jgi:hypothetical protein